MSTPQPPNRRSLILMLIKSLVIVTMAVLFWLFGGVIPNLLTEFLLLPTTTFFKTLLSLPTPYFLLVILLFTVVSSSACGLALYWLDFTGTLKIGRDALKPLLVVVTPTIFSIQFIVFVIAYHGDNKTTPDVPPLVDDVQKTPLFVMVTPESDINYPPCTIEVFGIWPCQVLVEEKDPPQTLSEIARKYYFLDGQDDKVPFYADLICQRNKEKLENDFYNNIPSNRQSDWDYNPCNFLVIGRMLILPFPAILPKRKKQTPTPEGVGSRIDDNSNILCQEHKRLAVPL